MNERLKQLAVDSKLGSAEFGNGIQYYVATQETFQKFAELIVRECLDIAQDRAAFDGFPPNDVNHIIDEIKQHFGVEE